MTPSPAPRFAQFDTLGQFQPALPFDQPTLRNSILLSHTQPPHKFNGPRFAIRYARRNSWGVSARHSCRAFWIFAAIRMSLRPLWSRCRAASPGPHQLD